MIKVVLILFLVCQGSWAKYLLLRIRDRPGAPATALRRLDHDEMTHPNPLEKNPGPSNENNDAEIIVDPARKLRMLKTEREENSSKAKKNKVKTTTTIGHGNI